MRRKRIPVKEPQTLIDWLILLGQAAEKVKKNPRKRFSKATIRAVLADQEFVCRECYTHLDVAEFDHIDGDRSNNDYSNCQALCPNCHARKTKSRKMRFSF